MGGVRSTSHPHAAHCASCSLGAACPSGTADLISILNYNVISAAAPALQVTPKRIYVLGLVATPPQNSDDGDPAAGAGSDGGKAPAPAISATDAAKAVGDVSPSWTAVHAEQVGPVG